MPARTWTPGPAGSSHDLARRLTRRGSRVGALVAVLGATACAADPEVRASATARGGRIDEPAGAAPGAYAAGATPANAAAATAPEPTAPPESHLGVPDTGIFSDLDGQVRVELPPDLAPAALELVLDPGRRLALLYHDGFPLKAYPTGGPAELDAGGHAIALRPGDRAELAPLVGERARVRVLADGEAPPGGDRDGDGLPDPLDLLVGGVKNALNAAPYIGGYVTLPFPGGDVPRGEGVCTDVVVRAARNAGLDLQLEVNRDIRRAPRAYPMVKRPNASIDHRRVKTILPYFERHWEPHTIALDDAGDPLRPGDVVFMDTFPNKPGPDHIGVISARRGEHGLPLVINAWTDGFVANEMDLLPSIPLTHRFRIPPPR